MGKAQQDTAQHTLRGVQVVARRNLSGTYTDAQGGQHVSMSLIRELPQILSNADPMHYAQLLPSVQTNSELDAGLRVQGCSTQQSVIAIGQTPIYNASHLLGLFSTFNATHFADFSLHTTTGATHPNCLGGILRMQLPASAPDSLSGSLDVGLMSSQGTVRIPLRGEQGLIVSARQCYFNLLYSPLIKIDGNRLGYEFGDYNLSYLARLGCHRLTLNAYYGRDHASLEGESMLGVGMRWQNYLFSADLRTDCRHGGARDQSLSFTGYYNQPMLRYTDVLGNFTSHIHTLNYRLAEERPLARRLDLRYGLHLQHHFVQPQLCEIVGDIGVHNDILPLQHVTEATAFIQGEWAMTRRFALQFGTKLNVYRAWNDAAVTYVHPDPSVRLRYDGGAGEFSLIFARTHQYLHQCGFSTGGLPIDLRFASNKRWSPQQALGVTLGWERTMFGGRYRFAAEVYGKRMLGQLEQKGDVLEFISTGFSLNSSLVRGDGYNYGINVQVTKQTGPVTGWIAYAYSRSLRRFDGLPNAQGYCPSRYERPHELTAVATWKVDKHWSVGGTFVCASGTPFTPVRRIYLFQNTLVNEYAPYNSGRLSPYIRLDLSANYHFRPRKHTQSSVNLSLYNATFSHNELYYNVYSKAGVFYYGRSTMMMPLLPSLSYSVKFY